ncbi:hypothetical protein COL60_16720 [Bacillus pseudomycoides]|uniref:hypothetical protein n=1 Tax=Bacillus pseudomycoides TaxID=64104 RepID=UPI000BF81DB0|nr:hypothetical protein [Bacillus pseudomycoides]PFZ08372.1 hypothetical protein COL60_16720 [Bacillus pseudomycoides]
MSTIIKRRHTNKYAQIHNNPLQNDLVDLRTIGLLSHLMSLPNDWIIYKTQLYKKFSRKNVEAAWKELAYKNYIIGFNCYINGKKQSFYNVSDIPFVTEELYEFVHGTVSELINSGSSVKSLSLMNGITLDITKDLTDVFLVHQLKDLKNFSTVPTVQYSQYSTESTSTKKINTNKKITNKYKYDDEIPNVSPSHITNTSKQNLENQKYKTQTITKLTLTDDDLLWITDKVRELYVGKIQKRSFDSVLKKCINNYKKGTVPNYENYLITSIENKIAELEFRREREKQILDLTPKAKNRNKKITRQEIVPDWLHTERTDNQIIENKLQHQSEKDIVAERERLFKELQKYKKK